MLLKSNQGYIAFASIGVHVLEGYGSWVCVSVKSHLTSRASASPENTQRVQIFEGFSPKPLHFRDCGIYAMERSGSVMEYQYQMQGVMWFEFSLHWKLYAPFLRKAYMYIISHVVVDTPSPNCINSWCHGYCIYNFFSKMHFEMVKYHWGSKNKHH